VAEHAFQRGTAVAPGNPYLWCVAFYRIVSYDVFVYMRWSLCTDDVWSCMWGSKRFSEAQP